MSLKSCLENLINGNLAEAKEEAKPFTYNKIAGYACEHYFKDSKALAAAAYLKGAMTFQEYCDHK